MDAKRNAAQLLALHGRWLTAEEFCRATDRTQAHHGRHWLRAHVEAGIVRMRHRTTFRETGGPAPVEYTLRPTSEWPGALREAA